MKLRCTSFVFLPLFALALSFCALPASTGYAEIVVLSENWLDDSIGSAPNTMPDIGTSVGYGIGSYLVFNEGFGDKGLTLTSASTGGYGVTYLPNQIPAFKHAIIDYTFNIDSGSNLSGANAMDQYLVYDHLENESFSLMWGDDNQFYYQIDSDPLVATGHTFTKGQDYFLSWAIDFDADLITIIANGTTIVSGVSLGSDQSTVDSLSFDANLFTTGVASLGHVTIGGEAVPEPSCLALTIPALAAFCFGRRRNPNNRC